MSRLGVDLGTVRIGIALSDELEIVASPHTVIKSRGLDEDAESVARLAQELEVCEIVVGMPRNMSGGREGQGFLQQAQKASGSSHINLG